MMHAKRQSNKYHKANNLTFQDRYTQLNKDPFYRQVVDIAAINVRQSIRHNDYLLHVHGHSLEDQFRFLKNHSIIVRRVQYNETSKGIRSGSNLRWIGYFLQYWNNLGYTIPIHEFLDPIFVWIFWGKYAGTVEGVLKYTCRQEVPEKWVGTKYRIRVA